MTNYNERLEEVLERLAVAGRGWGVSESAQIESMSSELDEAKQAITSLNRELVAGAKPKYQAFTRDMVSRGEVNRTIDQFEQNLLKALEEG